MLNRRSEGQSSVKTYDDHNIPTEGREVANALALVKSSVDMRRSGTVEFNSSLRKTGIILSTRNEELDWYRAFSFPSFPNFPNFAHRRWLQN